MTRTLRLIVGGLIVIMLGALGGWYLFVQKQVAQTTSSDAARGFGIAPSFGSSLGGTYQNISGTPLATESAGTSNTNTAPRLWQVTKMPVAGFGFAASSSQLYFAARADGNVLVADPKSGSVSRLTNTLFAKTYEARFAADGAVILRSLTDGITNTFAGTATTSTSTVQTLVGTLLPRDIVSIAARPAPGQLFYLVRTPAGVSGFTSDWSNSSKSKKQVFSSTLTEWQSLFLRDGSIYVVQNASDDVAGYAFKIANGSAQEVLGPIAGLEILPKSGTQALLYSSASGGSIALMGKTSASSTQVTFDIRTVAGKCVWAPGKDLVAYCAVPVSLSSVQFLRDWYSGAVHTTDVWWKVDVSAGSATKFFTTDSSLGLDVHDPTIDEGGQYLAFRNGFDETLWTLRIAP